MRIREAEVTITQPPPPARPALLPPPTPAATQTTRMIVPQPPLTDDEAAERSGQVPPPSAFDEPVTYRREIVIRQYYDELPDGRHLPVASALAPRIAAPSAPVSYEQPRRRRRATLPERAYRPPHGPSLVTSLLWFIAGVLLLLFFLPPAPVVVGWAHGFLQDRVTNSALSTLVYGTTLVESPASAPAPEQPAAALAPIGVVQGAPSVTGKQADEILASYDSPAQGTGQAWYDLGVKYHIDPAYAIAFFVHESSAGTAPGWAGWKDATHQHSTHNVGNIICAGYATCFGRFRDYPSWEIGIEDWYRLIRTEYLDGRHHETVADIIPVYAPASDNNNEAAYIAGVNALVDEWRTKYPQAAQEAPSGPVVVIARAEVAEGQLYVRGSVENVTTAPLTIAVKDVTVHAKTGEIYGLNGTGSIVLQPQIAQPLDLGIPIADAAGLMLQIALPDGTVIKTAVQ